MDNATRTVSPAVFGLVEKLVHLAVQILIAPVRFACTQYKSFGQKLIDAAVMVMHPLRCAVIVLCDVLVATQCAMRWASMPPNIQ